MATHVSKKQRNSSIELLRIIAMFTILMHHFIVHNAYLADNMPAGAYRVVLQLMGGFGKAGVVTFFTISAWFFLDKEQTFRTNLRRIWLMERELLFWSILLACFYLIFDRKDFGLSQIPKTVFPLGQGMWWYATAYAIFLAILPALSAGLRAIGRRMHLTLAGILLVIYGLLSFVPGTGVPQLIDVFGFVYLFILISAYRWYFKPVTTRFIWMVLGAAAAIIAVYASLSTFLAYRGKYCGLFVTGSWKLPMVMIGIGVFLLFERKHFHSAFINRVAQSAFAVYLITDCGASEQLLWHRLFNLEDLLQKPLPFLTIFVVLIAIYALCTILDLIRQVLFSMTFDRHRGKWFDLLWDGMRSNKLIQKCMNGISSWFVSSNASRNIIE